MEKIYSNKLEDFIEKNKTLSNRQFGFRKGHSTEHLVLALTDKIKMMIDKGFICALISTDFAKAFNSVPRGKLLEKLWAKYKISDHWLRDYLTNQVQYVSVNGSNSKIKRTLAGVPAGSILGLPFFTAKTVLFPVKRPT